MPVNLEVASFYGPFLRATVTYRAPPGDFRGYRILHPAKATHNRFCRNAGMEPCGTEHGRGSHAGKIHDQGKFVLVGFWRNRSCRMSGNGSSTTRRFFLRWNTSTASSWKRGAMTASTNRSFIASAVSGPTTVLNPTDCNLQTRLVHFQVSKQWDSSL